MHRSREVHDKGHTTRLSVLGLVCGVVVAACGVDTVDSTAVAVPPRETIAAISEAEPPTTTSTSVLVRDDRELRIIVQPDAAGEMPPDVVIGCPSGPTFPASALDEIRPLAGSGLGEAEAAARSFLDDAEGQFWPQADWQILHGTGDEMLLVHVDRLDGDVQISFIELEVRNGEWTWAGASAQGACPLLTSLPEGLRVVEWVIDPAGGPLTPTSTSISVLATERACASGQPMGDRLLAPEIIVTDNAVLLAFAATPPAGQYQDCQGNPSQSVVVELPEPLGDRVVIDGLAVAGNLEDYLD